MQEKKIKHFMFYIKGAFRFYELKNELFTPIIFAIILVVLLSSRFWGYNYIDQNKYTFNEIAAQNIEFYSNISSLASQPEQMEKYFNENADDINTVLNNSLELFLITFKMYLVIIFSQVIAFFIYKLYMAYYLFEVRKIDTESSAMSIYFRRLPKLITYNFLYYFAVLLGLIVTGIPVVIIALLLSTIFSLVLGGIGIALVINIVFIGYLILFIFLYSMFLFKDCYIIEKNTGLINTLKMCVSITKGNKKNIIRNIIFIYFLMLLPTFFITSTSLVTIFITVFLGIIINLILHRLIVLMYLDLNYPNIDQSI